MKHVTVTVFPMVTMSYWSDQDDEELIDTEARCKLFDRMYDGLCNQTSVNFDFDFVDSVDVEVDDEDD